MSFSLERQLDEFSRLIIGYRHHAQALDHPLAHVRRETIFEEKHSPPSGEQLPNQDGCVFTCVGMRVENDDVTIEQHGTDTVGIPPIDDQCGNVWEMFCTSPAASD